MNRFVNIFLFGLFFVSLNIKANELQNLTSMQKSQYHLLQSKIINHNYHIYINLPLKYAENPTKKYPTVYLLDGGITFPLLAGYHQYLMGAEELPEMIIVGISYGTHDYRLGNRRSTDFTAPAKGRDHYGGAEHFQNMLAKELFPLIEESYPSDPAKRIIFGQSIGGQFVIYDSMTSTKNFWGHIASNPAIHRNRDYFLSLDNKANNQTKLFISMAEFDDDRFIKPLKKYLKKAKKYKKWHLKTDKLKSHNHFSAAPMAFRNGMKWLLNNKTD
jgi:predicted alpha/beta superfamily hydrolase